jgi:hypothetical protein
MEDLLRIRDLMAPIQDPHRHRVLVPVKSEIDRLTVSKTSYGRLLRQEWVKLKRDLKPIYAAVKADGAARRRRWRIFVPFWTTTSGSARCCTRRTPSSPSTPATADGARGRFPHRASRAEAPWNDHREMGAEHRSPHRRTTGQEPLHFRIGGAQSAHPEATAPDPETAAAKETAADHPGQESAGTWS